MFNPLSLLIYGRTHPFRNPSFSSTIHSKFLTVLAFFSLFCIVFKVRCSQASLYIIPRAHFSVNTFFEVFLLFLHLFSKPLFFNGFRHLLLHFFSAHSISFFLFNPPMSHLFLLFSFPLFHSIRLIVLLSPSFVVVSTLFHRVLIFYCISLSALLQYLSEAYTASKHCSQ